jgi:hypothetical protein
MLIATKKQEGQEDTLVGHPWPLCIDNALAYSDSIQPYDGGSHDDKIPSGDGELLTRESLLRPILFR